MKALGLLIKPASGNCQLRCRYCFYKDVMLSRSVANYGVMSLETLETLVANAVREADDICTFSFQGGEPMLAGLDFYRELIRLQREYRDRYQKPGLVIRNSIQTNGLLLDENWCGFFRQNHFLVGLSLDGDKDIHDANRVDALGKGTYNRVMKAARLLDRHKVEYNVLCVVTGELARRAKHVYHALVRNGFRYLQFIPCIDDFDSVPGSNPHSLTADRYADFLKALFDEWYRDFMNGTYISIRHFDNWIHMLRGIPPKTCSMAGTCASYGVVEADGSVYPCDFYVLDKWRLGTVQTLSFTDMLAGERAKAFNQSSRHVAEKCQSCGYYGICRGGCRRDREPVETASGPAASLNIYCNAYEQFFGHALDRMRQVARIVR